MKTKVAEVVHTLFSFGQDRTERKEQLGAQTAALACQGLTSGSDTSCGVLGKLH